MYAAYTNRPVPGCTAMYTAQCADVSAAYSRFREDACHMLHVPRTIINIILHGQKRMYDGNAVHHLRAGDIFLIPRDTLLCSEILPGGFESLNLQLPDALVAGLLHAGPAPAGKARTRSLPLQMPRDWDRYTQTLLHCTQTSTALDVAALEDALLALLRQQPEATMVFSMLRAAQPPALGLAIRAVGEHLEELRHLEALAGRSCMSRASLQRHFRQRYQVSPMAWLQEQRLGRAGFLLRTTRLPIREIAYSSGFEDLTHFYRAFRRQFGTTPARWRTT
ncbi:hypothetical protein DCC81_05595 [Chitinophaga parva]|uniref:HTH araC/xylS-type domain-containing protein n=1 Tax=Chitinophaga parva TaxID=2169414 RepID=A0A2T7BMQ7_9BACT|nr:helix-turn-helix domain-containing protein [Chitinophaga parva]PUZ28946.1 hypothetical protein DCC81_05595 [Chitinophaga parva]